MGKLISTIFILVISISGFAQTSKEYLESARAKLDSSDYEGAIKDYNKAIKLDPGFAGAYLDRGDCKRFLGKHRAAIRDYTKYISLDPKNEVAYNHRAFSKMNLEDYRGAIKDFSKAIAIDSTYWGFYSNRGDAKYKRNDYQGAILDYSKAVDLGPSNEDLSGIYYELAWNKMILEDDASACAYWNKAKELGETRSINVKCIGPEYKFQSNPDDNECPTPFNKKSEFNNFAVKFKILPWTAVVTGSGINPSLGFEYGFSKNHSIGVDLYYNQYSFSAGETYDSTKKQYVANPRVSNRDKAIFLNYRYYLKCPASRERLGRTFYIGSFLRYGNLNFKYDKGYVKSSGIIKEDHYSVGIMYGFIRQQECFKRGKQLNIDVYFGIYAKQKVQFIEYTDPQNNLVKEQDRPVNLGFRVGLTLSLTGRR